MLSDNDILQMKLADTLGIKYEHPMMGLSEIMMGQSPAAKDSKILLIEAIILRLSCLKLVIDHPNFLKDKALDEIIGCLKDLKTQTVESIKERMMKSGMWDEGVVDRLFDLPEEVL